MKALNDAVRRFITLGCTIGLVIVSAPVFAAPLQFELNHHKLGTVTAQHWPGQYLLIGVGYTSCPDICPTTVMDMSLAMNALGEDKSKVKGLFISVDPHRDSAQYIDQYVKYFDQSMLGLVGTHAQTKAAAQSLKATYGYTLQGAPVYPPLPDQYEVFHSAYLYLYGPDRNLIDVFGYGEGGSNIGEAIARYLKQVTISTQSRVTAEPMTP
ncbi:SCO family protein [Vibrio sp. SM6]|uniref:SCO family protein n=2 Tax=Vibrio agarilyticus TaxID=2726741 RepID=A0A7X8TPF5_9VIBR|nr:SCO family protein [Vibrio agarilyticus]